jgi:arylformamidase
MFRLLILSSVVGCGRFRDDIEPTLDADTTHTAVVERDLSYGAAALDLYLPAREHAPVVVWVHGGAWAVGDKGNAMDHKVAAWNAAGWAVASINYRLSPNPPTNDPARVMYPMHPRDVAEAIQWLVTHAPEHGLDASRIAIAGHSAGAHLVALVGTDPRFGVRDQLRCVASLDTEAYDIVAALADPSSQQRMILENAFGTDPAVHVQASPQTYASGAHAPFLVVTRGSTSRKATQRAFAVAVGAELVDASGYSHEEVNDAVGADDIVTPPLMAHLHACLDGP